MTDASGANNLLTTALVGALLPKDVPEGHMVRAWLDSWSGVGHIVKAMHTVGYDVRLMQTPFCWWAEFCRTQVKPPLTLHNGDVVRVEAVVRGGFIVVTKLKTGPDEDDDD